MATDGYFEITGTYDEDDGEFLDADGNESFTLNDEHGIANVETFTFSVSDGNLLKVWKAMGAAASLEREVDETSVTVRMRMDGIDCQPEDAMNPRYGMAAAASGSVKFEAQDKHSPVTVETREIDLREIEAHLVAAELLSEADCRSDAGAAAPAP